jgi:hypothetical protein
VPQRERTATCEGEIWAQLARPCGRLRRADAAGRPPDAAATQFGREGYRSTPVTGLARDAQAGSTVACACFPRPGSRVPHLGINAGINPLLAGDLQGRCRPERQMYPLVDAFRMLGIRHR